MLDRHSSTPAARELGRLAREEVQRSESLEAAHARIRPLSHALRVLCLLPRAVSEFEEAGEMFLEDVRRAEADTGASEEELFRRGLQLAELVHLRMEAFYALSRSVLDQMAQAIESFLGPLANAPLGSHRQLEANLAAPGGLLSLARRLSAELGDDRDLHVLLGDNPRRFVASVWVRSGDAGIHPGTGVDDVKLSEVLDLVDEYVREVVRYLEANRSKC